MRMESVVCVQDGFASHLALQLHIRGQSPEGLLQGGKNYGEERRKETGQVEEDREEADANGSEKDLVILTPILRLGEKNEEHQENREAQQKAGRGQETAKDENPYHPERPERE